jgi:deoxyadenosine/deoxycytidine kinase
MSATVISVEGNIGSGKTTLLSFLKEKYRDDSRVIFLKEPVDEWESVTDDQGVSILRKFYANQEKYAFSFQMMAFISRLKLFKDLVASSNGKIIITERCLYTDRYVFCKMLFDLKKIEDVNYQIYCKWFDTFAADFPVQKCLYIQTDPRVCFHRVGMRQRDGEEAIPLEYLVTCDKYHHEMIFSTLPQLVQDLVVIDGTIDVNTDPNGLQGWLDKVDRLVGPITDCV